MGEWKQWLPTEDNYEGPLDENTKVEVKYQNGETETWLSGDIDWSSDICGNESFLIQEYRVLEDTSNCIYDDIGELSNELGFTEEEQYSMKNQTKYDKVVFDKLDPSIVATVDVYSILEAFNVTCPALAHLTKKSLNVGSRGHKNRKQDLLDIIDSAKRAYELELTRK